ncbi:hypothetical protein AB0O52_02235 [Arthrobacter sp. NPDC080073]
MLERTAISGANYLGRRCSMETTSFEIEEASIEIDTLIVHRS